MAFWKKSADAAEVVIPDVPGLQDLATMDVPALMDGAGVRESLPVFAAATVLSVGDVIDNEIVGEVYPIEVQVTTDDGTFDVATSVRAGTVVPSVGQSLQVSYHRHEPTVVAVLGPA